MESKIDFRLVEDQGQEGKNNFQLQQPGKSPTGRHRRPGCRSQTGFPRMDGSVGQVLQFSRKTGQSCHRLKILNVAFLHIHVIFSKS